MTETELIHLLAIGLDTLGRNLVGTFVKPEQLIMRPLDLEKLMEEEFDPPPAIILCGFPPEGLSTIEVAQSLRMKFQEAPIYLLTGNRSGFDRKTFQKNGFTEAFLLPMDSTILQDCINEIMAAASQGAIKAYRQVKLVDLTPEVVLDFDTFIFLPMNKKYIRYSAAGEPLESERAERLKKHQVTNIHISHDQMSKFYEFTANQLRRIGDSTTMSATEKQERAQSAVRDLISGLFNDSIKEASTVHGKAIIADCQEIVKAYIMSAPQQNYGDQKLGWYERILQVSSTNANVYSHAVNVSTFATLFSVALGIGKPEELGIAGILHDIGVADIPETIQLKPGSERTADEEKEYQKHPELSVKLIQDRKLVVSPSVIRMVLQHHERFNGKGYPKGLPGPRILPEAQILGLADEFDCRTSIAAGKARVTPLQAMQQLHKECCSNPADAPFNPELITKLMKLFPEKPATQEAPVS